MIKALAWQNNRQKNRLPDERAESSEEGISSKDGLLLMCISECRSILQWVKETAKTGRVRS
jgi:glycerol kinase